MEPNDVKVEDAQKIIEQYDIPSENPALVAVSTEKPRDPETGKFVKSIQHPKILVKRALEYGIDQDTINETPSEDLREAIRDAREAQMLLRQSEYFSKRQDEFNLGLVRGKEVPVEATPQEEDILGIKNEAEYDETLLGILKAQAKKIQELERLTGTLKNHAVSQVRETEAQQLDRAFESLDPSYASILGRSGRPADGSTELLLRKAVISDALKLAGDKPNLQKVIENVKKAAEARFGKLVGNKSTIEPPPVSRSDWEQAGLARPNGSNVSVEKNGPSKALQSVERYLRENAAQSPDTLIDEFVP